MSKAASIRRTIGMGAFALMLLLTFCSSVAWARASGGAAHSADDSRRVARIWGVEVVPGEVGMFARRDTVDALTRAGINTVLADSHRVHGASARRLERLVRPTHLRLVWFTTHPGRHSSAVVAPSVSLAVAASRQRRFNLVGVRVASLWQIRPLLRQIPTGKHLLAIAPLGKPRSFDAHAWQAAVHAAAGSPRVDLVVSLRATGARQTLSKYLTVLGGALGAKVPASATDPLWPFVPLLPKPAGQGQPSGATAAAATTTTPSVSASASSVAAGSTSGGASASGGSTSSSTPAVETSGVTAPSSAPTSSGGSTSGGATTTPSSPPPPTNPGGGGTTSAANLFVKPALSGGDDTLACTSLATACASLNGAFQKAHGGDRIEVMDGSYGVQTVYPSANVATLVTFFPESRSGVVFTNAVQIRASHVEMDDFDFGYVAPAAPPAVQSYTPALQIDVPNASGSTTHGLSCVSDIVIKNANGKGFAINNGVSDLRIVGGTWGNQGWSLGTVSDGSTGFRASNIGASTNYHCPDASTIAAPATDVTIDGVHFGNNFQGCQNATIYGGNPQSTCVEPTHPDCLHVMAPTIRLTIENSWFDHCMGFFLNLNIENSFSVNGNSVIKDALFQNDIFGDDNSNGYDSWNQITQAASGPLYVQCDNVVFRNNTWGHNQAPNPLFALNCPVAPGASRGVQFYNNIFMNWNTTCPSGVTFDYNLFVLGPTCGTHASAGDPAFMHPQDSPDLTYPWAAIPWTSDFHLTSGSAAIGAGSCDATKSAATDVGGEPRPQDGSACDVGAFNH